MEGNEGRPGLVHRIDKDTSGLLVIAKTEQAQDGVDSGVPDTKEGHMRYLVDLIRYLSGFGRGRTWVRGHWRNFEEGEVWVRGHWRKGKNGKENQYPSAA